MKKPALMKLLGFNLIALVVVMSTTAAGAQNTVIKFALLAPEGSAWMQIFNALNREVMEKTGRAVQFRYYPGGVLGDEKDVLRKIVIGQIQGALLTTSTMTSVFDDMEVFQVPFLFRDYPEVDYVREQMEGFFKSGLAAKGYALLGWSEGGFVRLMSMEPMTTMAQLRKAKVWTWNEAPMTQSIFKEAGVSGIPLSLPDVLVGLQTGLVDVVYAPPAAAISLQWFTRVKYITDVPLSYITGVIVVKKDLYDGLTPEFQAVLSDACKKYTARLQQTVREENLQALQVMEKNGVRRVKPTDATLEEFKALSAKAMQRPENHRFSDAVLEQINQLLNTFRGNR
jgi:TRAP-type C4-dicarboxylate transport system substrate-binding protein